MLSILSFILFAIIFVPLIIILLVLFFGLSIFAKIVRPRHRYSEPKPKGTIEILPAEKDEDSELEAKLERLKDRKVGKDKFREL